jgi:hypothetical protein
MLYKQIKGILSSEKEHILQNGFVALRGIDLSVQLDIVEPFNSFACYWNNLKTDSFMHDGGKYRQRRIGKFSYYNSDDKLVFHPNETDFFQSKYVNAVNGGIRRNFLVIEHNFAKSLLLNKLIRYCLSLIPVFGYKFVKINTHLFRVVCNSTMVGLPTPEGIHRDGHHYVSQHLIARYQVRGGISGIYDLDENPLLHCQLNWPLDSLILDDQRVKHDVSPVFPKFDDQEGYRDVLIIDYNFLDEDYL